jgi:hypothetical protein
MEFQQALDALPPGPLDLASVDRETLWTLAGQPFGVWLREELHDLARQRNSFKLVSTLELAAFVANLRDAVPEGRRKLDLALASGKPLAIASATESVSGLEAAIAKYEAELQARLLAQTHTENHQ